MLFTPIRRPGASFSPLDAGAGGLLRLLLIAAAIFGAVRIDIGAVYIARAEGSSFATDFKVFWTAGRVPDRVVYDAQHLTAAQEPLTGKVGVRPFVSPPSLLALLKPLGAIPFWPSFALWTLASLGLLIAAGRRLGGTALLFLLIAPALHFGITTGQVTTMVCAALLAGMSLLPSRPIAAGLLFAAAALLKPQTMVLLPLALAAGGHWRALIAAAVAGAAAGLACLLLQGPALWSAWLTAMAQFPELIREHHYLERGISPASLAAKLGLTGAAAALLKIAAGALGIAACWQTFRRSADPALRSGALVCGYLLCTPYAMIYEALALAPAAAAMLAARDTAPANRLAALFAICLPVPAVIMIFAAALLHSAGRTPKAA